MHEITCPHCDKAFKVDEAGYADILKQVRDVEFEQQLHERLELAEKDKLNAVELAKSEVGSEMQKAAASKDAEIQALKAQLDTGEVTRKLAVTEALGEVEKERHALASELEQTKRDKQAASELADVRFAKALQETAATKDKEIQNLKTKLDATQVEQKVAITGAVSAVEKERDEFKSGLKQAELEKQLAEKSLKDKYETQIKDRDDAIERLRDMKARLSTKMAKPLNSTAILSSTAFEQPRFRGPISKKIMMHRPAVRATLFFATRTRRVLRLFRSCLK